MDNIAQIYYINLDQRTDRNTHFITQAHTYFPTIENRIHRFPAIYHQQGLFGCSLSHLEVIKHAKLNNTNNNSYVLIFEDDFQFIISPHEFEHNITHLFNLINHPTNPLDFKVIMLAYNAINRTPYNELLDITTNAQTCSGYLVNSKYFDELIQCWEQGITLYRETGKDWLYCCDQYWKTLQNEKWFIFKTRIGIQQPGYSDCGQKYCDYQC